MKPKTDKLCDEYAYATECQLATLSGLMMRKRSPKSEIKRQTSICAHMLTVCRNHWRDITWDSGQSRNYPRAHEVLLGESNDIDDALDQFKRKPRDLGGGP